jgi:hypothetical protein
MKEIGKFLLKMLGIVLILLFAFWLGSKIWNGVNVPTCQEYSTSDGGVDIDTNTDNKVSVGGVELGEETICKFAEGYDAEGKAVPTGTVVTGPAFVKPDRDISWGYPIYVGEEYTTTASDEVIWLLIGDNACVDAQSLFFSIWSQTKP